MAIDTTRILNEIDKHTKRARNGDAAKTRDSVVAIRALCDLLLEDEQSLNDIPAPRAVPRSSLQSQTVTAVNKLKEDDANGDSLFEF
ncbi:YwdI family protein [Planococcus versutus]|uniref:Uncharacterized protein n=1 Tax=Planococcus versutus TaxID=1302659 RepID=A0A1B1S2L0_9BACL|nr:YwdI family protein [Planococcus versutus]ANU27421.1 hypothetical protein I858_010510 [Planococcus versutus]